MKKLATGLLVVAAIIGASLFWLSDNIDGLIKDAIADYGTAMTKAKVNVEAVKIRPTDGKAVVSHLLVANPAGFKTAHALKVSRIDVEIDQATLAENVILIRRIAIIAPDVIYEKGDSLTNFDAIQKNISAYLGPAGNARQGKKLIVEELTIRDAKAQASAPFMNGKTIDLALPDITLKNIGKDKGGITPGELGQEVTGALKARLTGAVSFERLMKSTGDTLDKAGAAIKGLFK